MRLLWISNHPESNSGYGTQTRQVGKRLKAAGHDVAFLANFGQAGMVTNWEGSLVLGTGVDRYSRDIIAETARRLDRQWAISLYDGWVYDMGKGPAADPFNGVRAAGWLPVDHYPAPPTVTEWARRHYTIAMTRYGQGRFQEADIDARYAPHALEPAYRPTEIVPNLSQPFRKLIGVPQDAFLIGIVAANIGTIHYDRKSWSEMLQSAAHLAKRHSDVFLYIHSAQLGPEGVPLHVAIKALPDLADRVKWVDQWAYQQGTISDADMASIYTAFDVLLATSRGEGFGLPVIEAQACGTPVIVSDWTAQPELVGAGWKVPVQPEFDFKHAAFFGIPSIPDTVRALEEAYAKKGDPELQAGALAKAAEYGADTVFETYWQPILAEMEGMLAEDPPKALNLAIRPNRKRRKAA